MHAVFIPYGKKECVDVLIRDMTAQKHKLRLHKEGEKDKYIWMEAQVRVLPFGFYEYIFPKEDLNIVLATMDFDKKNDYISKARMIFIRKMLKLNKIPKFKSDLKLLWVRENVTIIPIGIREDIERFGKVEEFKEWRHEAI